jgi:glycine/D-amino acid oxidase-like deaminating enzyme/nitrite reductase/ring-hydroxylating ferredoxin subunit
MGTLSVWRATAQPTRWSTLAGDISADVTVVGAGITGVTTALRLAQAGQSVVLIEAHEVGGGDTGGSTGNLYQTVSGGLDALKKKWGTDVLRSVVDSRAEAIAHIEQQALQAGVDCAFRRCPMFIYAGSEDGQAEVQAEWDAASDAGLPASLVDELPDGPPRRHGKVLMLERQAQFHPLAYVQALAAQAATAGCRVFEQSAAIEVDAGKHTVRTAAGTVRSRAIVLATHSPSGFHLMQAGMVPHREYGLAAPLQGGFPDGIFWARGAERLSVRVLDTPSGSFLLCVGQDHKTGQHDAPAALATLESAARRRLPMADIAFRWSAQNFQSPDGLPYIGQDASGAYVATGFATDGLVYGTLAGLVIADQILGRDNRWSDLYKATRFTPLKSARVFGEETASVVKVVVQDYLTHRQHEQLATLGSGDAAIVALEGERVAAYRDPSGQLYAVSPVCTHLKCQVHWNPVETSWDCPCHGSRFAPDGRVLEGPAIEPLQRKLPPLGGPAAA